MKISISIALFVLAGIFFPIYTNAAYQVEQLPDATVYKDFVVGPGKIQLDMKPGQTKIVNIIVSNRLGSQKDFQLQLEDFTGSRDTARPVVLLEDERGPYSLKDYLEIASSTVSIAHATRVTIPVTVRIPSDAQPGGLYGSVVISTVSSPADQSSTDDSAGKSPIVTRIGTLFFIRVAGDVKEDGKLTDFTLSNNSSILFNEEPIDFRMLYENNGTIHENPYGLITIENIFGSTVGSVEVEPWFALPNSLRLREVAWSPKFLFGRYVATAEINRGYGNIIDTKTLTFWVIPWMIILLTLVGLIIIIGGLRWILSRFKIARK